MRHIRRGLAAASALGLLAAALAAPAAAQSPEFKTITMVVGATPGGGYDAYTRLLARSFGKYLPGEPNVIVQNMPGSGSLKAVLHLDANAPKDGSVMTAFNPGVIVESLTAPDKINFKLSDVAWIGSITADLRACYAWHATGVKNWDDLMKRGNFNIGTQQTGSSSYNNAATLKNLFGAKIKIITGYPGSAEERLAIERGELDGGCGAWSSNPPAWLAENKINPIVKFAPGPVPNLPSSVPYAGDLLKNEDDKTVLKLLTSADAVGRPYVASKAVPADRLALLRKAFDSAVKDPQFVADAAKSDLPVVGTLDGASAAKIIDDIYGAPPRLIEKARETVR
ncbi:MAG: Bug family tripartite tricarboxylate transporter substrate binding protein [Alphaproteobacteria bacterium]